MTTTYFCTVCKRTSDNVVMLRAQFYNVYDMVVNTAFICESCKKAFEWGGAHGEDDEGYVEYTSLNNRVKEIHELDLWHAYRNALAAALSGVAGESRIACVPAANIVIDRRILPPAGEARKTYRDCGLFASMYVLLEHMDFRLEKNEKLSMEDFVNFLTHGDVDVLRCTYGYRSSENE